MRVNNNRILLLTLAALVGAVALYVNSNNETDTTAPIDNTASPATSKQEETMTDSTTSNTISTSSGLQYRILKEGSGIEKPEPNSVVTVHYRGKLTDGFEFDSSYKRNQPATFPVNGVIRGWTEALQLMSVGDKWELTIPPELGYGSQGAGDTIPPDAILIFEVELLEIK